MQPLMIQNNSIKDQVYHILHQQIIEGKYNPGDRITEQSVADSLNVSRSPVREAILQLVKDGMLVHEPNRGVFVKKMSQHEVADCFKVRALLEEYALSNIDAELLAAHTEELNVLRTRLTQSTLQNYPEVDSALHALIMELTGNAVLINIYKNLYSQISSFRNIALVNSQNHAQCVQWHLQIIDAVFSGNSADAVVALRNDLNLAETAVQTFFEQKKAAPV